MSESGRYFVHNQRKIRVVFEPGSVDRLPVEVDRLGCQRVVLVASTRYVPVLTRLLNGRVAAVIAQALMHVPAEEVDNAVAIATATAADGVVAVGGGSAIGLAKAIALRIGIPILAAPTTYSGSEMTRVWGITTAGKKATGRDEDVAPKTVVYDPDLLSTLAGERSHSQRVQRNRARRRSAVCARSHTDHRPIRIRGNRGIDSGDPAIDQRRTTPQLQTRSTGRGCAGCAWTPRPWHCITRFVMLSAAHWACRMPRHTPRCFRTHWRSMLPPSLTRSCC